MLTYWGYHLIFTIPLAAGLAWLLRRRIRRGHVAAWAALCAVALIATTPWDNWAAARGIWGFGEHVSLGFPFRSLAARTAFLGHIPVEEYAFFVIQTTLGCLGLLAALPPPGAREPTAPGDREDRG